MPSGLEDFESQLSNDECKLSPRYRVRSTISIGILIYMYQHPYKVSKKVMYVETIQYIQSTGTVIFIKLFKMLIINHIPLFHRNIALS